MAERITFGGYNAALLTDPNRLEEEQDRAYQAIDDLGQPDVLAVVELATRETSPAQLEKVHRRMGRLGYVGVITDGIRERDRLRTSAWVKEELATNVDVLKVGEHGYLPQVATANAVMTAVHLDSTTNKERATTLRALRHALDNQQEGMDPESLQVVIGDFNGTYNNDSRITRAFRLLNGPAQLATKLWPGFDYYNGGRLTQMVSDAARVFGMPNNKTMGIVIGGDNGFSDAAGPGESAPTLRKGSREVIRTDRGIARTVDGSPVRFEDYRVHDFISGDHAGTTGTIVRETSNLEPARAAA